MARSSKSSQDQRAALDVHLGKVRHSVLERPFAVPISRGDHVRLKGYGTSRTMLFVEYVERPDDPSSSYVTVLDCVDRRQGTGAYISVRPDQLVRLRSQPWRST